MRIALTVDPFRPGQDRNLEWFAPAMFEVLRGNSVRIVQHAPMAWSDWAWARFYNPEAYAAQIGEADLVVGFEMPPAIRDHLNTNWIDIRRHPKCYDATRIGWSIRTNFATERDLDLAEARAPRLPHIGKIAGCERDVVFAMQVEGDAQMMTDGRLVTVADFLPALQQAAEKAGLLWLAPHPMGRNQACIDDILSAIPNAEEWKHGTYTAMASMPQLITWTSSTGFEAPDFGCQPTFLGKPYYYSKGFYPIDHGPNWSRLLAMASEEVISRG